ncbi:MAG: hypothetical protein IKH23_10295 [Clostridiales bacterium]|nr:hypothetical protein [Clostridiales bacterium]
MNLKKICATSLALCMTLLLGACRRESETFPSLNEEPSATKQTVTETSAENKNSSEGIRTLKVALPYSDQTIRCLAAMFYSKNNGTWDSSVSGLDVNIDSLTATATNYVIRNTGVTSDGASLENLQGWRESGEEPDLYLAADSKSAADAGLAADISVYASRTGYIDGSKIYAASMSSLLDGGKLYGLPHYCSATIIFGNKDLVPKSGRLQTKCTSEDLTKYLEQIHGTIKCIPLASGYELMPYLGSCFSGDKPVSYMMQNEYRADKESAENVINAAAGYIRKMYDSKYSANADKDGADPVYARNAALWIDSSASCRTWEEYYPGKLYYIHLPCSNTSNPGVPYLRPYTLCVSQKCEDMQFAVDFASFISYDEDAQLLLYRLENLEGLLPLVRSGKVWNMAGNEGGFGVMVTDFRQMMDNAVYCPGSFDNRIYRKTNEYTILYFGVSNEKFNAEACYGVYD